jgi:protein-S-isoprenylcysteine O-methyltransferase Ste14
MNPHFGVETIAAMTGWPRVSVASNCERNLEVARIISFCFGLAAYAIFLGTFLYAIGFVAGVAVPKGIDSGEVVPTIEAIIVNVLLLSLFALQHSLMARKTFKQWWTKYVPTAIERSAYVLFASLTLLLLFWQWRPIPTIIWQLSDSTIARAFLGLSLVGWFIVLLSTFLINHFELFGLRQVFARQPRSGRAGPRQRLGRGRGSLKYRPKRGNAIP